jgi:hypothetical protein
LKQPGFTEDEFGQWIASNCRVKLYQVGSEYELDILLPNGSAVGCDVPIEAFGGRTADEIGTDDLDVLFQRLASQDTTPGKDE